MPLQPFRRKPKNERQEELRRKWGSTDSRTNEGLEGTHRWLLQFAKESLHWDKCDIKVRKHFLDKLQFEEAWQKKEIHSWKDFYMGGRELYEKEKSKG